MMDFDRFVLAPPAGRDLFEQRGLARGVDKAELVAAHDDGLDGQALGGFELGEVSDCVELGDAPGRANVGHKAMTVIHSVLASSDGIDDCEVLRAGSMVEVLGRVLRASSPIGIFLRSSVGPCPPARRCRRRGASGYGGAGRAGRSGRPIHFEALNALLLQPEPPSLLRHPPSGQ